MSGVNEAKCWIEGRDWAIEQCKASKSFVNGVDLDIAAILLAEPGVDMLLPYRVQIGVLAGTNAEYNLLDQASDDDDDDE